MILIFIKLTEVSSAFQSIEERSIFFIVYGAVVKKIKGGICVKEPNPAK